MRINITQGRERQSYQVLTKEYLKHTSEIFHRSIEERNISKGSKPYRRDYKNSFSLKHQTNPKKNKQNINKIKRAAIRKPFTKQQTK